MGGREGEDERERHDRGRQSKLEGYRAERTVGAQHWKRTKEEELIHNLHVHTLCDAGSGFDMHTHQTQLYQHSKCMKCASKQTVFEQYTTVYITASFPLSSEYQTDQVVSMSCVAHTVPKPPNVQEYVPTHIYT